jgi:ABC-type Na+ efflux pump permease subunit
MTGRHPALLIARLRLLDAVRDRRAFLTSLLLPLVLMTLFGAVGAYAAHEQKENADTVKVAILTSTPGADGLLNQLPHDAVDLVRSAQPISLLARDKADLVLTLADDTDARLAAGRPVQAQVLGQPGGRSAEAFATLEAALRTVTLRAGGRDFPVSITTDHLEGDPKAIASAVGRTVPMLTLVIALPFLGAGLRALTNTRMDRSIEHLLPLPVSRRQLLGGLALGSIGAEAVQQALFAAILLIVAPTLALTGAIPWAAPAVLALAVVLTGVTAGSIGILLGVSARSDRLVGVVRGVSSTLLFAAATGMQFMDRAPHAAGLLALPLIGPAVAARAACTSSGLGVVGVAAMVGGAAVTILLALGVAERRLSAGAGLRL